MRPLHIARLDKPRPVVVLTRELIRPRLKNVTVAPITSTIRGLSTEVLVGTQNGLDHPSAISCDNIQTIPKLQLGRLIGYLLPDQELLLTESITLAFDLDPLR
ncbi:mRNA interferase MazF [Kribbella orskensis]|uniref:mRNA interferase MazF n=1 Tax=Kribbella orskensis TaxID=2512216 RepID=A0ABY2BTK9_9ACTN|nr:MULTISPECIES: type II toxin-antitoxin system PemK/MazF family toxin [Kribbella]TCN43040.1 mRNA interferase MazF [Kribbella sp. VKM Ac-2500]TCO29604.1 mRNA interferase MazF [Kribbella orskensis]